MARARATSPRVSRDVGPPRDAQGSCGDNDQELCGKLKAYLAHRSQNTEPPPPLAEAWDHFYAVNAPRIRAFLRKRGLPASDHEDCCQEVWSDVLAHLRDLPYDSRRARLSTWLIAVARNRALDIVRRRRPAGLDKAALAVVDPSSGPVDEFERLSTQDVVRRLLAVLSTQVSTLSMQVFIQRTIEERTTDEVARSLNLTPEQVRCRLHRTKRKFRDLFERSSAGALAEAEPRPSGSAPEKK